MTTYTNPTGTLTATEGDDTIVFTALPAPSPYPFAYLDALGGQDSLTVQVPYSGTQFVSVLDQFGAGYFNVGITFGAYEGQISVNNLEAVNIQGGSGNDRFNLQVGTIASLSVSLDGGAGDDLLKFDWSNLTSNFTFVVSGSAITSTYGSFSSFESFELHAGAGDDTITTGTGNDNIYTGTGADSVNAGGGNDFVYSQSSAGSIDGGAGIDYINWSSAGSAPVTVSIGNTVQITNGPVISNFEGVGLGGGSGDDLFTVTRVQTSGTLYGAAGHDTLVFNASYTAGLKFSVVAYSGDQLDGQISVDQGNYQAFFGFENVSFTGTQFNDQFSIRADYSSNSSGFSFDGGDGVDTLNGDFGLFTGGTSFVVAPDGSISSNRGSFAHIETFVLSGGAGADTFTGGSNNDVLEGGAGADHLEGGAGNDTIRSSTIYTHDDGAADVLIGGAGNDSIEAGYGDSVDGGSGTDQLSYNAENGGAGITVDFSQLTSGGTITIAGAALTGIEAVTGITGTKFNDTITAGATNGAGVQIFGLDGDDRLIGSADADLISGGEGNDILTGGLGADRLYVDAGDDTVVDTLAGLAGDTIIGLGIGDKIIISDANLATFGFSYSGGVLTCNGVAINIFDVPGRIVASAATGGGVQLEVQLPPYGTEDQIAAQLTSGYWNGAAHHFTVGQGGTLTVDISTLNSAEQTLARAALGEWSDIIGVHFQEVSGGAQITFDHREDRSGPIAATDSVWANGTITSSHIQISSSWVNAYGSSLNSYSFQTYLHEIGHALGLGHPGNYNETGTYRDDALFSDDSWATSVMSYFNQGENYYFAAQHFSILNAVTPMQADILAAQTLYGLSTNTRSGDTIYGFHSNAGGIYDAALYFNVAMTIYDSGGNDTLDYSNVNYGQLINLNPETFSNVNSQIGNLSIARGVTIENAIGGFGADTIIGNAVGNVITGGPGGDTLTGAAGHDVFRDTAMNMSGDTVTDFTAEDRIVITDASLVGFTFSLSGHTLSYTGGSLTLGTVPPGRIVASAAAGGGVQLTVQTHDPANDFNGDGYSDILWRTDAAVAAWLGLANGGFRVNDTGTFGNQSLTISLAATGDFNGDLRDDLLWRGPDGSVTIWLSNSAGGWPETDLSQRIQVGVVDPAWHIVGAADVNGDGKADILWRDDSGQFVDWLATGNGAFVANWASSGALVPTSWTVAGTGDFNGDGRADILWRNDAGITTNWLGTGSGGFVANWANASFGVPLSWSIAGTGDFNGDRIADVLWRSDTGMLVDWLGNSTGGFAANWANAPNGVGAEWQVAEIGDFNGDGRDDILWRNSSGRITEWLGNSSGGFTDNSAVAATFVDNSWHIASDHGVLH